MRRGYMSIGARESGLSIFCADDFWNRTRGLLGRPPLNSGEGFWITPCNSVHTLGMTYCLDLIYLDRSLRIVSQRVSVRPWQASWCRQAYSVVELPEGELGRLGWQVGERVTWHGG